MLRIFRMIAIAEGISFLLFGLTMPMKYVYEIPEPNFYVGIIHGVLFLAYCIICLLVANLEKWNFGKTMIIGVSSIIPFGTFWAERKYLRD